MDTELKEKDQVRKSNKGADLIDFLVLLEQYVKVNVFLESIPVEDNRRIEMVNKKYDIYEELIKMFFPYFKKNQGILGKIENGN